MAERKLFSLSLLGAGPQSARLVCIAARQLDGCMGLVWFKLSNAKPKAIASHQTAVPPLRHHLITSMVINTPYLLARRLPTYVLHLHVELTVSRANNMLLIFSY